MEAIHILGRIDGVQDGLRVHPLRQRQLNEDPVDLIRPIEALDEGQEFGRRGRRGQGVCLDLQPGPNTGPVLVPHVHLRGRIVTDQTNAQPGHNAHAPQSGYPLRDLAPHLLGDGPAVDDESLTHLHHGLKVTA